MAEEDVTAWLQGELRTMFNDCGCPSQYLDKQLTSAQDRRDFGQYLATTFPKQEELAYCIERDLPNVTDVTMGFTAPTIVSVADLGCSRVCSTKTPDATTALAIVENVLVDGFKTTSGPLLVLQPASLLDDNILPKVEPISWMSLGYVKGFTRACTVLSMIRFIQCSVKGYSFQVHFPQIYESVRAVIVYHLPQIDLVQHALTNARLTSRSSVRKPYNVITWAGTAMNLNSGGVRDRKGAINMWNAMAPKSKHIVGRMRTSLNTLLEFPHDAVMAVIDFVLAVGLDNCPFTDDSLGNTTKHARAHLPFKPQILARPARGH